MTRLPKLRLLLFVILAALALLGAVNPFPAPVVVVYPLTVGGGADQEAGANLAVLLSTKLAEGGGVIVKPATPGTQRAQYLEAAKALGADYYVTGFLTPLGDDTSLIAQVVSTYSGSVVYSTTAFVRTYGDAVAQGDVLRKAILDHAGRGLGAYDAPESYPTATAEPTGAANQANLSKAFSRRRRATPAPSPSPTTTATVVLGEPRALSPGVVSAGSTSASPASSPAPGPGVVAIAPHPAAGQALPSIGPPAARATPAPRGRATAAPSATPGPRWLITTIGGDTPESERTYAGTAFVIALRRLGIDAASLPADPADIQPHGADLCNANPRTSRLFAAALSVTKSSTPKASGALDFNVTGYDCAGALQTQQRAAINVFDANADAAIDRLARQVSEALLRPPPPAQPSPRAGS